jgi:hypothetical protein
MSEFTLPEPIARQLEGLPFPVYLFDASGKKLGCFIPVVDAREYEELEPELSDEELRRIEQSDEWYSTDEVLRHLGNLG